MVFFSLPALCFPLFVSGVGQVPVFSGGGGGLMAGLSGFTSHQCSLHLGAGCL